MMFRRSVLAVVVFAIAANACVPAAEEASPRGAMLVETVPSAGSRGEAFVTADGWTVHVDVLLLQVYAMGVSMDRGKREVGEVFGKPSGESIISASQPAEMLSYGVPAGPADADVVFTFHSVAGSDTLNINKKHNIDPALAARFKKHPDVLVSFEPTTPGELPQPQNNYTPENYAGPTFLVIARGEKDGRVVKLDIALQDQFGLGERNLRNPSPIVQANTFVKVPVGVVAENLFAKDLEESSTLLFGDYAAADANGDGIITAVELADAREPMPCTGFCTADEDAYGTTMAKALSKRVAQVFRRMP